MVKHHVQNHFDAGLMQRFHGGAQLIGGLLGRGGHSPTAGIASRLGLDEIGFKGPSAGQDATGAALTFGKRLSKDLYVTYERSLSGTLGTLYMLQALPRKYVGNLLVIGVGLSQLAVPLAIQLFPSAQADFNHPDGPCAHWGRVCPFL